MKISTGDRQYSALQVGFEVILPDTGYSVLTGINNSAKSTILQLIFRQLCRASEYGTGKIALITTDRAHVYPTTQTENRNLEQHNGEILQRLDNQILQQDNAPNETNKLPALLLGHNNLIDQVGKVNQYLKRLQLEPFRLAGTQMVQFTDVAIHFQGSGMRSLFYILSALSDETLSAILIDEPELSLDPRLERILRELFIEEANGRLIVVATHSNLFLNREIYGNNYRVFGKSGNITAQSLQSQAELYDTTFNLLGNSLMDLFFPGNYLIVEGSSDQVIAEKLQALIGVDKTRVKVLAASGIDNVQRTYKSVINSLLPLIINDSPYSKKVIALIDAANNDSLSLKELRRVLPKRVIKLNKSSLEDYLPESLYTEAGRVKAADLEAIARLHNDYIKLGALKKEISDDIAKILTTNNMDQMPKFIEALNLANSLV